MTADLSPVLVLVLSGIAGLVLIPLGLPGLWIIVLGILGYGWLTDFRTLSVGFIVLIVALALLAEAFEVMVVGALFAALRG